MLGEVNQRSLPTYLVGWNIALHWFTESQVLSTFPCWLTFPWVCTVLSDWRITCKKYPLVNTELVTWSLHLFCKRLCCLCSPLCPFILQWLSISGWQRTSKVQPRVWLCFHVCFLWTVTDSLFLLQKCQIMQQLCWALAVSSRLSLHCTTW